VPIVAGTDQGLVAYSLDRELQLYVDAGLTPLEAIRTATLIPARVMHQDALSGTLEPGRKADLIIVGGNPLTRISDLRNVKTVIKDGQVYDPVALRRLVGFAQ
jgi:imidazolonepropionase-like amidohydrolase